MPVSAGGVYIPPFKLKMMMEQAGNPQQPDQSSEEF